MPQALVYTYPPAYISERLAMVLPCQHFRYRITEHVHYPDLICDESTVISSVKVSTTKAPAEVIIWLAIVYQYQ